MNCPDTCSEHTKQVSKLDQTNLVQKIFGAVILALLVYLLNIVAGTNTALLEYKTDRAQANVTQTKEAARITEELGINIAEINGAVDVLNTKVNFLTEDMSELKLANKEILSLITEINLTLKSNKAMAEAPVDSMSIKVNDL